MFILYRIAAVVFLALLFVAPTRATPNAALEGIVKDAKNQPLKGAEIRIQGRDPSKIGIVHTDANGHYVYPMLEAGTYSVVLVANGSVKASISNVKTQVGVTETLNFGLQKAAAAKPFAKGKHYVWVPADTQTGTHVGRWIEANDSLSKMPIGMQERLRSQDGMAVKNLQDYPFAGRPF